MYKRVTERINFIQQEKTFRAVFESVDKLFVSEWINAERTNTCWQSQVSFGRCNYLHLQDRIQERHPVVIPFEQSFPT